MWVRDCPGKLRIVRNGTSLIVTCLVDNPINLLLNGSFEEGKTAWSVNPAGASWDVTDGAAHITVQTATWVGLRQYGFVLTIGQLYRLTWKARSTASSLEVAVYQHASPYTNYGLSLTVPMGATWRSYTSDFTAIGGVNARLQFKVRDTLPATELWLDDIRLEAL